MEVVEIVETCWISKAIEDTVSLIPQPPPCEQEHTILTLGFRPEILWTSKYHANGQASSTTSFELLMPYEVPRNKFPFQEYFHNHTPSYLLSRALVLSLSKLIWMNIKERKCLEKTEMVSQFWLEHVLGAHEIVDQIVLHEKQLILKIQPRFWWVLYIIWLLFYLAHGMD